MERRQIFAEMGIPLEVEIKTDSVAARGMCYLLAVGKVRYLKVRHLWIQQKIRDKELQVVKVEEDDNLSNVGTKDVEPRVLKKMLPLLGMVPVLIRNAGTAVAILLLEQATATEATQVAIRSPAKRPEVASCTFAWTLAITMIVANIAMMAW